MAAALVQTGTALSVSAGTSGTITLTSVSAGDLLTVVVDDVDGSIVTFSASDDKGNTWNVAVYNENGGCSSAILYCLSAAAGTTIITVTASGSTTFIAQAQEWSGGTWTVDTFSSIDESATTSHVCSASSSVIDTTGNDLVLCNSTTSDGTNFGTRTAGSGYTSFSGGASPFTRSMWQYQVFTTAQANERGAFTSSSTRSTAACIAAFKCSVSAGGCWWPCCTGGTTALYTIFFGNKAGAVPLSSVEQYSPSPANTWATKTSGSPARTSASTASLNSAAYTFGGIESSSPFYMSDNDEYVTDVWTAKTNMPTPSRYNHEGMTVGNYCYSVYGDDGSTSLIKDADQYDPAGDSWASKTDAPTPVRYLLGAAGIGTKGYTWGGVDATTTTLRDCEEYDPSGNTWTSKTDMPTPARSGCGGFDIGSDGYSTGGDAATSMKDTDKYTPGSDSWAADTDLPAGHQWTGDESNGSVGYSTNGQVTPGAGGGRSLDHYGFATGSPGTWNTLTNCSGDARQLGSAGFA